LCAAHGRAYARRAALAGDRPSARTEDPMAKLTYTKPEPFSLKCHPEFNERWLQDRIVEDTTLLGLGELVLVERERRQERAGRLDLCMADLDGNRRFEIELQLGPTDESHIIRTIEYWDIERRRYPGYDHCAVLVAEDVTNRFVSLLALFAGTIPLIVIQLNALRIGDTVALNFVRVLDQRSLRRDDLADATSSPADRGYWVERASEPVVALAEEFVEVINQKADPAQKINFNKHYIGLTDGVRSRNFVHFRPRKKHMLLLAQVDDPPAWVQKLEEAGLSASIEGDATVRLSVAPPDLKITALLHEAVARHQA